MKLYHLMLMFSLAFANTSFAKDKKHHKHHHHMNHQKMEMKTTDSLPDTSLFQIGSSWKDQNGKKVQFKDFSSHATIFAMAYTSCEYACPVLTATMLDVEDQIKKKKIKGVQFLFISLDPKKDTPSQLKKYAKKRGMGEHWTLITSDDSSVRELAAVLGINYKQLAGGDIAHSNVIFLMDKKGVIKSKVVGLKTDPQPLIDQLLKL